MKGYLCYPVEITHVTYGQFCEETGTEENPFINSQEPGFKIERLDLDNENISWQPEEEILPLFKKGQRAFS